MRATEMHDLLRDAQGALLSHQVWTPGTDEQFKHIAYCRYCHYSRSHGHHDECVIVRLERATGSADAQR